MITQRFAPDKEYLNAKFDGYKLTPIDEEKNVLRTKLPNGGDLKFKKFMSNHRLGFRDLQARVRLNHLAYGLSPRSDQACAFYVDLEFQVICVMYSKESRHIDFRPIVQLIQPLGNLPNYIEPSSTLPAEPYAPSLIALNAELLLASNGAGNIELVHIGSGTVVGTAGYQGDGTEGISPVPCVLLSGRLVSDKVVMIVYSRVAVKSTQFNICALEMSLDGRLTVLHIQRGHEVPAYCAITKDGKQFILGSESPYENFTLPQQQHQLNNVLDHTVITDTSASASASSGPLTKPEKPLYSWTQDDSDITVQFKLPVATPKTAVSCQFNSTHLSLIVPEQSISYPFRKLWSGVNADDCTWTLESDGTLTLYLSKQDIHTRWPHLFDIDDNVPETLDPAKLAEITERLEKFTSSEANNPTVQNPVAADMDEDIDDDGEPIRFAVYDRSGRCTEEIYSGGYEWICGAFDCEKHKADAQQLPSTCVKADVDGQVYAFYKEPTTGLICTKHIATFDAFAFVHASKRDSRFVHYDPNFKFIMIAESSRNAYIYYRHGDKRTVEAQALVDLTRGDEIDVLGCQLLLDNVVLLLTETEIIAIHV